MLDLTLCFRNCKMKFDNAQSLANHVKKFCSGSSYGDVKQLDQRLQQLGSKEIILNPNLNFQDVRNYLSGNGPVNDESHSALQKMNLDDLRNYFQSENKSYEELQKQALRAKERQLMDEVEEFKREKQELRVVRAEQDRAMQELLRELDNKRDRELRARVEKAEIQKALQEVERNKMTALEREKRRELERLAAEREQLRMKEDQVLQEISQLEARMEEKERLIFEEKQKIQSRIENEPPSGRRKVLDLTKERAEHIAQLQLKRDMLEKDRMRIMEDLEKVRTGDMSGLRKNEASRWAANDILARQPSNMSVDINRVKLDPIIKDRLISDEVRINQLREQRQKTLKEIIPVAEEFDPLTRNFNYNRNQGFNLSQIPNNLPAGPQTIPSPQKDSQQKQPPKSQRVTFTDEDQPMDMVSKIQKLREDYALSGESDPEFFAYLRDLENHIVRKEPLNKMQANNFAVEPVEMNQQVRKSYQKQTSNVTSQQPQKPTLMQQNLPTIPPMPSLPYFNPLMGMPPNFMPPLVPPLSLDALTPQVPTYIAPPIPQPKSAIDHDLELQLLQLKQQLEPAPIAVQNYIHPEQNKDIEKINRLIQDQESQNILLERELEKVKNGLTSFEQFETLLTDPVTQRLEQEKLKLLGGAARKGGPGLTDDFRFRQNDYRAEDMEAEERVLANIAAQEFDQLRILSKIPKDSDLYRHKMQQYKEMSAMRTEMEKVLQEQKLEKIRREFEKQKIEDQKRFQHERWLEEQQKQILEAKLAIAAQPMPEPELMQSEQPLYDMNQIYMQLPPQQPFMNIQNYQTPRQAEADTFQRRDSIATEPEEDLLPPLRPQQTIPQPPQLRQELSKQASINAGAQSVKSFQQSNDPNLYNPNIGFNIYFDFIARLQRQYRSMRVVYAVYNVSRPLVPPSLIDIHDAEPDPEDPQEKNRIIFREFSTIKNVQPHPSSNLIIELQVPKPNTGSQDKFISFGWTVLNLFDNQYIFNRGIFRLPIYQSPTKTDIDIRDMQTLQRIPDTVLLVRIGNPDDANTRFQMNALTTPEEYAVPKIHQFNMNQPEYLNNISPMEVPTMPDIVPLNPGYECKGVRCYVHFVKHYVPPTQAKVQLTLYEGMNIIRTDEGRMCNWASKQFDSQNLLFSQPTNPMNQNVGITALEIQRGEIIAVEDEVNWNKDIYRVQFGPQDTKASDLSLVIQLMEAKGARVAVQDGQPNYQALGYGVFRLNNPDGTIRFGTHDIPLFKPPVNLTRRNPSDLIKQVIKITIEPPIQEQKNPFKPQNTDQRRGSIQPQKSPMNNQQLPNTPKRNPFLNPNLETKHFIQNMLKQFKDEPFKDGEGIDFYIDGARFLPENSTFSRVIMRVLTIDQIRVINPVKGVCDLDMSTRTHPFFPFRFEIRGPKLDPTLVVQITIETIDRSDLQAKVVGHCYFPLFLNTAQKTQSTDRKAINVILQNGSYQLPIYLDKLPTGKLMTLDNISKLEKIPCATLLVRAFKAPIENERVLSIQDVNMSEWKTKGVIVDPPDYNAGAYNTQYTDTSQHEIQLYNIKGERESPDMRTVTNYLIRKKAFGGITNDNELIAQLDNFMAQGSMAKIDMRYFSAYVHDFGFRFSVERLHGIITKQPHVLITSIAPPSNLYNPQPKRTPDVAIFSDINMDSQWKSLRFNEDPINYTGLQMTIKLGFVIDVKAVKQLAGINVELEDVGWTFVSIYSVLENEDGSMSLYCNSGLHALPIFPGPVPKDIQQFIQKNQQNIMSLLKTPKNNKTLDSMSVIVRIHDNQREWMPPKGYLGDLSTEFLPQDRLSKFVLPTGDSSKSEIATGQDSARSMIPQQLVDKQAFRNSIMEAVKIVRNDMVKLISQKYCVT